jgi:hypothetical protein
MIMNMIAVVMIRMRMFLLTNFLMSMPVATGMTIGILSLEDTA